MPSKVHYFDLLPHEFRARLSERAIGYLPLGTIEWHGEQCALGSDALISRGLFERAALSLGGIVFPPLFLGPDSASLQADGSTLQGMDAAEVTDPNRQLDGSCYWIPKGLFFQMCEAILMQAARAGFKCIVADGHGPSRGAWGEQSDEWEKRFGLKLVGVSRDLQKTWQSQTDHAARNETSLMMALHPDLVDLEQLEADRNVWPQGVGGEDPRDSTVEHGGSCLDVSLKALSEHLAALGV
ncbi:MAG: creatininase family protein [Candidatus Latescibacteria bacterium]|jgi:creatinine amidohydrolase|nr:creatininase family protein [Candidatus Latescibacterota bacterium]